MPLNDFEDFDDMTISVMEETLELMDEMTGGSFKAGSRMPTLQERIAEWDSLTADQMQQLRDFKGDEWTFKQAAEIERLRKSVVI